jgi:outer membrane biogenesis lipoprotein LolB
MKRCFRLTATDICIKAFLKALLAACVILILPACAGLSGKTSRYIPEGFHLPDSLDPSIRIIVEILQSKNRDIKTFKGTGRINYSAENSAPFSSDIAWVAGNENKLLIVLRGLLGEPLARIATDGERLYYFSHVDNRYYSKQSVNPSLESLISIPLKSKDIIYLLSGRVPFAEFDSAIMADDESGSPVIVLNKRWSGIVEKIYLDGSRKDAVKVEMFDSTGDIIYSASFDGENMVGGYLFPSRLVVSNGKGDRLAVELERCWADMPVSSFVFSLSPP